MKSPNLVNNSDQMRELTKFLGLPNSVTKFTLDVQHDKYPVVTCTYYPSPDSTLPVESIFRLVPVETT